MNTALKGFSSMEFEKLTKEDLQALAVNIGSDLDFNPLWDFILILPFPKKQTKGGVLLPDGTGRSLDDTPRSLCIKAGAGAYRDNGTLVPNPIKPGHVVYNMGMMKPFTCNLIGASFFVMSGRDCVATADTYVA